MSTHNSSRGPADQTPVRATQRSSAVRASALPASASPLSLFHAPGHIPPPCDPPAIDVGSSGDCDSAIDGGVR